MVYAVDETITIVEHPVRDGAITLAGSEDFVDQGNSTRDTKSHIWRRQRKKDLTTSSGLFSYVAGIQLEFICIPLFCSSFTLTVKVRWKKKFPTLIDPISVTDGR